MTLTFFKVTGTVAASIMLRVIAVQSRLQMVMLISDEDKLMVLESFQTWKHTAISKIDLMKAESHHMIAKINVGDAPLSNVVNVDPWLAVRWMDL